MRAQAAGTILTVLLAASAACTPAADEGEPAAQVAVSTEADAAARSIAILLEVSDRLPDFAGWRTIVAFEGGTAQRCPAISSADAVGGRRRRPPGPDAYGSTASQLR